MATGIRPRFGMFEGGSESPDDAIEWILHLKWQ
jgi:hypothetical protein